MASLNTSGRIAWRAARVRVKEAVPNRVYYLGTTALRTVQHLPGDWRQGRVSHDENPYPLPPPYLRYRVSGGYDVRDFHTSGREGRDAFQSALTATCGRTLDSYQSILDFGVGCGRIARWLEPKARGTEFHGADIDRWAVRWCRRNLPFITCVTNQERPPLPYDDNRFDLVYSHSVFTHLDSEYQDRWLRELRRVLLPGGTALLTVHGDGAFEELIRFSRKRGITESRHWERTFERAGFFFNRDSQWAAVFPDFYQNAYQSQAHTRTAWGETMTVVDYLPGGMRGTQDMVILRN